MARRLLIDLTPLRTSRDFRRLFMGQTVSMIGSQLTVVDITFQVYSLTGSSFQVGAVSLAQLVPFVAGALAGGALGDAIDRRRVLVVTSSLSALASAGLALNAAADRRASVLALYLVPAVAAGLSGVVSTIVTASVPSLVASDLLTPAYATMQVIDQVGMVIGPALAGLVIAEVGLPSLYGLDALTFLWTAFFLAHGPDRVHSIDEPSRIAVSARRLSISARPPRPPGRVSPRPVRHRLRAPESALSRPCPLGVPPGPGRSRSPLRRPGCGGTARVAHLGMAKRHPPPGPSRHFGGRRLGHDDHRLRVCPCSGGALALLVVAGFVDLVSAVLRSTIVQSAVAEPFRSRIFSLQMAVVEGGPRLGDLESGTVASAVSTQFSVVSGGIVCVVGTLAFALFLPKFRRQNTTARPKP